MKRFQLPITILLIFFATAVIAASLPKSDPVPGGIVILKIKKESKQPPAIFYGDDRVVVIPDVNKNYWRVIVGVPLEAKPGQQTLKIKLAKNQSQDLHFKIKNKHYPLRRITIADKSKVTPSPEQAALIKEQYENIENILSQWHDTKSINADFILPVKGVFSSPFGQRRIFNKVKRARHTGLDIAAKAGTSVKATAAGEVMATGDYVLTGNTIFINHGQGLISYYCHLDSVTVEPDQMVKQGEIIGTVGNTGRSTAAHLHWGVSLNGTNVNPLLFVKNVSIAKSQKYKKANKH